MTMAAKTAVQQQLPRMSSIPMRAAIPTATGTPTGTGTGMITTMLTAFGVR